MCIVIIVANSYRCSDRCSCGSVINARDPSGTPRVAAAAAAEGVWCHVRSGRCAHLHPPQLRVDHGAGARPADGHSRSVAALVVVMTCLCRPLTCVLCAEHEKMCYSALLMAMIFSMGEQIPLHHYGKRDARAVRRSDAGSVSLTVSVCLRASERRVPAVPDGRD